jgi:hypothetical protein
MQPFPSTGPYDRPDSIGSTSSQGKQLQTKAERRAEHNAIERARRESLNVKFQQLAFTLPNLQNDTRPSKSTIIDRTLDFVKNAIIMEERYQNRIQELEKFNKYLLSEADNRLKRKKQKKNVKPTLKSTSTSPVTAPALISSPTAAKTNQTGSVASEEEYDDEDEDEYSSMDRRGSTEQPVSTPMKQTNQPFVPINGAHNNHHHLPVSQSSVPMMPTNTITNWPIREQYIKEEQPYYLPQQMIIQKFQDQSINNKTEQDGFHTSIYNHYPMLNNTTTNSFMSSTVMMEPEHLMHRR